MALDASLQPGAAGEITLESTNKTALRKGKIDKSNSTLMQGFDIDENSDKSVAEQAHTRLRWARVWASVRSQLLTHPVR